MSLIWPAAEADIVTDGPRLHALVIAVSDYPHLNGGSGALANDPLGLNQITTPHYTGPGIADWLRFGYSNPQCPLGSLEVVMAPAAGKAVAFPGPATTATMHDCDVAVTRWWNRCHAHRDNIAWFYFCGHGLSKIGQFLLPQDFGDPSQQDPWRNCIDFDGLRLGMRTCKAQTQLFFVDACRETPFGLLTQVAVKGVSILGGADFSDKVESVATYYAATQTRQAYGPDDDVTYFGQALIWCLSGAAALNKNKKWVVDTYSLGGALGQVMTLLGRRHRLPLACDPNASGLRAIHYASQPRVVAAISCTSEAADHEADIRMSKGATVLQSKPGEQKPLVEPVDAGDWQIDISFPSGTYPAAPGESYTLMPPVFEGVPVP